MKRGKNISLELKDMIILMNRLERLSPKRISEKLNVSINTVKTIVRKSNKADRNGETPKLRVRRLTEPMNTEVLIKRLRMENQLLRDFLQLTGRK
jgi:transposase